MADRHVVAFGESETQHDEYRMINIHIGKRGAETANEELPEKLSKTAQSEHQPSSSTSASSTRVSLEYLVSGERQNRTGPVLVWTMTYTFPRLMCSTRWMDERVVTAKKWDISQLNDLIENMTALNAF